MKYGLSYLGGGKYHDVIMAAHPHGWPARFFVQPELFDCPKETVRQLIDNKGVTEVFINLAWQDDHVFSDADLDAAVKLYEKTWLPMVKRRPNVTFYVSGATEHNLTSERASKLAARILAASPVNAVYVNNPLPKSGGQYIRGKRIINDVHGKDGSLRHTYIYDYDGTSMVDDDINARIQQHKDATHFFLWHPAFNGRLKADDATPRPERTAWPTVELIKSMVDTISVRTPMGKTELPTGAIYKTHADRHVTPPEARAYKPVLLTQLTAERVEMRTPNGHLIAISSPRQPFSIAPNTARHYFNEYGSELAHKAIKVSGRPMVNLVANGTVIGRISPALRAGKFR